jgi:hypothetical protein
MMDLVYFIERSDGTTKIGASLPRNCRRSPKLATAKKEPPAGPIPRIMTAVLEPAKGARVVLRSAAECQAEGRAPVPPEVFMDAMARFCKSVGIKTRIIDDKL